MALSPGSKIGPYEILSLLGAGGMGEVYRGRDGALGRDVAVKVLPAAFSADADRLRRFKQEAQAAASLNHPNILTIYHIGEHDGAPYIVSELLEGESLRQRFQSGPLPVRKTIDYAIQVARGLAAAHDKGIVHRDLKPENIFLTKDGRAKILDFGLAKLVRPEQDGSGPDSQTLTGRSEPGFVLGTAGYMSPEQVRGQIAGPASDLFAFGAVLYEALTGRRAFRGDTAADTMSSILKEDPPDALESNRQIPPGLERIIRHCLEKNPEERFQSARDVAFNLEALSSTSTSASLPEPTASRSSSKWIRYASVALGFAVAFGLGAFVFGRKHATEPSFHRLTFRQGTIQNARFAPDGQSIIYSASWDGNPADVFTTRPQGPDARSLGLKGATLLSVSKTGELAVMLGAHPIEASFYKGTLARIPLEGGAPREIQSAIQNAEWSPDGTNLLIVHQVGGMDNLEYPPGKVISQGGAIDHQRFSPHGDQIAFFSYPSHYNLEGSVVVVDLAGHKTVLSTGWADLTGMAWSPDGSEIWFTGDRDNGPAGLFAVDLKGHQRLVHKIPGDMLLFDIASDGRLLLAREDWRGQVFGLGPGDSRERDLSWFDFTYATDISPDGRYVLFGEEGDAAGGVVSYLRKMDGSAAVRLSDGDCEALSQDAQRVICGGPDGQLREVPTGTGDSKLLTHDHFLHLPDWKWLPGERQFTFGGKESDHGQRIYVQDVAGGDARPLTPEGSRSHYAVSPDQRWLGVPMGADYKTYLFPMTGGDPKLIPGLEPGCLPATWSPDSQFLYCYRMGDVPMHVFRVEVSTGRSIPWKELMPPDPVGISYITDLHFSSDMKSYVYDVQRKLDVLYLVDGLH